MLRIILTTQVHSSILSPNTTFAVGGISVMISVDLWLNSYKKEIVIEAIKKSIDSKTSVIAPNMSPVIHPIRFL